MADTDKKYTSVAAERKKMQLLKAQFDAVNGELGNAVYVGGGGSQASTPSFDPETQTVHITAQTLSSQQKAQARENIGAGSAEDVTEALKKAEETTWAALKAKRDAGQLTQGMWYRITDYQCTTTQEGSRAVNNQFDILVLATGEGTLSESARAAKHPGIPRLYKTNVENFPDEIDYNDYFDYVDTFEFDGNTYYRWRKYEGGEETDIYILTSQMYGEGDLSLDDPVTDFIILEDDEEYGGNRSDGLVLAVSGDYFGDVDAWQLMYSLDNDNTRFLWADAENGKGVIYWMRDEWGNECPYDFKNIQFLRYRIDTCENVPDLEGLFAMDGANGITVDTETEYWCYTFSMIDTSNNEAHDVTVEQDKYWGDEGYAPKNRNNVFKPYYKENYDEGIQLMALPNNVMVTDTDMCSIEDGYGEFYGYYDNSFGNNCYNNTIGNYFQNNSIGNNCYNNSIGESFYQNSIGNECYGNTIGNNFNYNTIGNYFRRNTIGNECYGNTIGNNCYNNSIGNGFNNNTIGNWFYYNSIGNECYGNTIGNSFGYNTIGESFYQNSIGNDFNYNTIGNWFYYNTIGNGCNHINIQKAYVYYIIIENGNQYINITSTQTTSDSNKLRNFTVSQGVNNSSTTKTISHNTVNDTFKTIYQNASSTTVNV